MTFIPMYNLDDLDEQQKQEYYLAACKHFNLPPDMNLLAFIWLDNGEGQRHLALYAKKGATDLIREHEKITTESLTMQSGANFVSFIARGVNGGGRAEMAVGSAFTEGLKGRALEAAVMTAQTRATRRMTLQFLGGGLLDESEVNSTTTDINKATVPLATLAPLAPEQPVVQPNSKPGKDITVESVEVRLSQGLPAVEPTPAQQAAAEALTKVPLAKLVEAAGGLQSSIDPVVAFDPVVLAKAADGINAAIEATATVKKTRKKRTVSLDSPGQAITEPQAAPAVVPAPIAAPVAAPVVEAPKPAIDLTQPVAEPDPLAPTAEEARTYRNLHFYYTNTVLREGGMTQGVAMKFKKFAAHFFKAEGSPDITKLNRPQYERFFAFLDDHCKANGAADLVQLIEDVASKQ